jgi:hypothetical protein
MTYLAFVLDEATKNRLLAAHKAAIPAGWQEYCHHLTWSVEWLTPAEHEASALRLNTLMRKGLLMVFASSHPTANQEAVILMARVVGHLGVAMERPDGKVTHVTLATAPNTPPRAGSDLAGTVDVVGFPMVEIALTGEFTALD